MKMNRLTLLAALGVAGFVAWPLANAQTVRGATSAAPASYATGLTRTEVLADLQVWRSSGLATFEADPGLAHIGSRTYEAAQARYAQSRSSADFYALVQSIATRTGESVPQRLAAGDVQAK